MEIFLEVVFQFLFELFAQLIAQILFEISLTVVVHAVEEPFKHSPNPWLAAIGYALLGAACGAVSLWALPSLFISSRGVQILNLILTPVISGLAMSAMGSWRRSRGQYAIRLDTFSYGFLFALAMALVRFAFSH